MPRPDFGEILAAAAAIVDDEQARPCNRRCRQRGHCAFRLTDPPGHFCREGRPPRRGELNT